MENCVFCRIAKGELPASKVYEDDSTIAFMDLQSVNPGHMLVVVKPHRANIYELDDELASAAMRTAAKMARAAKKAYGCEGVTLLQANEPAGAQTVFHFHIHVLPRWEGDGMALAWPAKNPTRDALEEMAAKLRAAL
ncbi:MAG: HIT family protein [Aromatoleum sp.]|jgi:histidine triad (HIT) family protein|uniref:HIT family protein n=1 Tax=Aromatoleum sp. TaxID=2307007 RepID=UPI0028956DDC|nr:HIT family protein [Aromatoleum sp.]MDT3671415.1 HIT family protein [Aromatoleum sp.]